MPPASPRCSTERRGEFVTPFEVWQKGAGTLGTVTHLRGQMGPRAACGIRNTRQLTDDLAAVTCRRCLRMAAAELSEHRRQRGYVTLARGRWSQAEWIAGKAATPAPPTAARLLSCSSPRWPEAEHAKSLIDSTGCGHACRAEHELVDLGKSPAAVP